MGIKFLQRERTACELENSCSRNGAFNNTNWRFSQSHWVIKEYNTVGKDTGTSIGYTAELEISQAFLGIFMLTVAF